MRRSPVILPLVSAVALVVTGALLASPQNPNFRGGTDLLMLDVSVLDKSRQSVADLTSGDFTVTVDGQPRPVVAFKFVAMPPPPPPASPTATWVREIAPDVVSNERLPGRVVAILIDDKTIGETRLDPFQIQATRKSAMAVVDQLGPDDRAAVLYTKNAFTAQTFTTDRRLLRAAIENSAMIPEPKGFDPDTDPQCQCRTCSIEALDYVAKSLRPLTEQRKVVFFVSAGPLVVVPRPGYGAEMTLATQCNFKRRDVMHDALRSAQAANVTIQSVDPTGLDPGPTAKSETRGTAPGRTTLGALEDEPTQRQQFLRMIAEQTGGRAVVNNNDPDQQVPSLFAESSSYYLLGVEPPAPSPDGKFHGVEVRVNRRDVEVRTRNGYYDLREKDRVATVAALNAGALTPLIASPMPAAGVPLAVTSAPFAGKDGDPIIAVTLTVDPSVNPASRPMPRTEVVDIVASAFYPETGGNAGWQQQRLSLRWTTPDPRFGSYELLGRVAAPPGRYELRVGVKTADGRTGGVYTSVEVPDFTSPLSLSGLVVTATPSPAVAPPDALADILPVTPTARRTFRKADQASAFVRIYQRARNFSPATVKTTLTSATGEVVADDDKRVEGAAAGPGSAADYQVDLPLADLAPGEYLLTIGVVVGNRSAQRQLRFRIE